MLYLETPVGVGFSYAKGSSSYMTCHDEALGNRCEPFSTYPRTYDLIHASGLFSMYMDNCDITDIVIEMQRIIRPKGTVIIKDHIDVLVKVKRIVNQMRWDGKIFDGGNGPYHQEKVLIVDNSE